MTRKLVIWGASGHATVVADIVRHIGAYEIVGFLDDLDPHPRMLCFARSLVLGGREQLERLRDEGIGELIVAVGDCEARLALADAAEQKGFRLARAIHPRATVASDVVIGDGSVVCAGAVLNPGARIGRNVIVNTGATVDHGCVVEDGVHLGPGTHLGGNVCVGRAAWLGIGATVVDHVTIGSGSILGAAGLLLSDLPPDSIAYGVPATVKRVRSRTD